MFLVTVFFLKLSGQVQFVIVIIVRGLCLQSPALSTYPLVGTGVLSL